jgi:hypothetical protein
MPSLPYTSKGKRNYLNKSAVDFSKDACLSLRRKLNYKRDRVCGEGCSECNMCKENMNIIYLYVITNNSIIKHAS